MARPETRLPEAHGADADELRKIIGANICAAQDELGIKNEDLSHRVGLGLRLVQKHRSGKNSPTLSNLARYANVLEKPVAWFFEEHP